MNRSLSAVALIVVLASAAAAQRTDPPNPSVLIVSGEAQIRVAPDEATVRMGIVRQARTAAGAQDQANTVAKDILAAIAQAGVPATEVRTTGLQLSPMYEERSQPPRISGYQASNFVSVRVTDLAKVGPVIDAGLRAGANEIHGIQFGLRDDLSARQLALKQAVTEARKKADSIAEAANIQIIFPLEISETGVSYAPKAEFGGGFALMARAADMAATPVAAGDLEIRASVTIRYQIGPKR